MKIYSYIGITMMCLGLCACSTTDTGRQESGADLKTPTDQTSQVQGKEGGQKAQDQNDLLPGSGDAEDYNEAMSEAMMQQALLETGH